MTVTRTIPTVSYSLYTTDQSRFISELRTALLSHGFLYLIDLDTSISSWSNKWDRAFSSCRDFFDQTVEDKMKIGMINSPHFRGYSGYKVEVTAGKNDLREQIDFGPESPTHPGSESEIFLSLYGPNLFPNAEFESSILEFRSECHAIAQNLLHALALSLTSKPNLIEQAWYSKDMEKEPDYSRMKVVQYPPVKNDDDLKLLGVGAHKDGGGLTLLAQDMTGGLQVQAWDGEWIDVKPKDKALVINIGQVLERLTAGVYSATTHRVLPTLGTQPRLSIPFFFSPTLLAQLRPLEPSKDLHPDLIEIASRPREEISEVKKGDLHSPIFGNMAWRGITRSHGDVWKKYYGREKDPVGGPEVVC